MFSDPKEILVITVSKIPCLICACVGFFSIIVLRSSLRVYGVKRSIYRQSFLQARRRCKDHFTGSTVFGRNLV